jgi:putative protease
MQDRIARVTHFYNKIGVAILELEAELALGDKIKFVRGGEDLFEQVVESIQKEHEYLNSAQKGMVVGLKTKEKVREGAEVYKLQ